MIQMLYGNKKGYEILETDKINENNYLTKHKSKSYVCKAIKIMLISFILTLIIYISIISGKYLFKYYKFNHNNKFIELIPRIKKNKENRITNLKEIFNSRRLYINEENITREYIRYLRPIDLEKEKKFKQTLYSKLSFENYKCEEREGQLSINEFYNLCINETQNYSIKIEASEKPLITIVLPVFNKKTEIIRSIRSIQKQTFKNIEIIIVDDCSTDNIEDIYNNLFANEPRLRLFKHLKNMGVWRSRMDGFLYSRGEYVLHFDPGDLYSDNYVLEDSYNLITKYNLDTVRFSFSKVHENIINQTFGNMFIYPSKFTKIIYGVPDYNVHEFGYGLIWNRLVRANIFTKALGLVDEYILNAYKNLWEDMWWNDLVNKVSFSNLIVNRYGYIYLFNLKGAGVPKIRNSLLRDKTIKEFIYFWLFDLELLPVEDNKKSVINQLRKYNKEDNKFCRLLMTLDYLNSKFPIYGHLLTLLINDPFVEKNDKQFLRELYKNSTKYFE